MNRVLLALLLLFGCGDPEGVRYPACGDAPDGYPHLTGAPYFSAARIGPGEPLSVMVPVSSDTRAVTVRFHPAYDGLGGPPAFPLNVNAGTKLVEYVIEDTEFPDDVYVAGRVWLEGAGGDRRAEYASEDWDPEAFFRYRTDAPAGCVTDILPPLVEIVSRPVFEPPNDSASQ